MTTKVSEQPVGAAVAERPEPTAAPAATTGGRRDASGSGRVPAERFDVLREVGKGGMATIFLARDREDGDRPVAFKVIHPHLAGETQLVERFKHEVRVHVGIKHPNVVDMIGWGEDAEGRLFMAMEFIDGPTLKQVMAKRRRVPADVAVHVVSQVLAGLGAVHGAGVVHRDVKPANVMLTRTGEVKIADFGISKGEDMTALTSTGNVIGTPAYMSPEQALGRPVDPRSDLFSVGVLLHELLLGANPFQADNPATTLSRVVHHPVRRVYETLPQVPARLDSVAESLLQKDVEARARDVSHALSELARCAKEDGLAANAATMAAFMAEPDKVARKLDARQAQRHFENGLRLQGAGPLNAEAAVWEFFLATLLDPRHAEARNWLEQLSSQQGYNLQGRKNARIEELEARLKENPESLPVVLQLAKLHKAQGNFLQVIYYYRRAKSLRPPDAYTKNQIQTLVSPGAASIIEGTGLFETEGGVPVRTRPKPAPAPEPQRAEDWTDFIGGILSTGWGRFGAFAAAITVAILVAGSGFDKATQASMSEPTLDDVPAGVDPELERGLSHLERARHWSEQGEHEKAEGILRRLMEEVPETAVRSEALFLLGDTLERQGRRPAAVAIHDQNAAEADDEWAMRSLERTAEISIVEDDLLSAHAAYDAMATRGTGEMELRALAGLADLDRRKGHLREAAWAYESILESTKGTPLHDSVRLDLAGTLEELDETSRAASLYREVRDTTDHRSEAYRDATAALDRLGEAG